MESPATDPGGLSTEDARRRLAEDGPNQLPDPRRKGLPRLAREVITEPMFLLLVACGAVYLALGDRREALMLLGFVVVVMALSLVQQRRSERALQALRELSVPRARVLRDGRQQAVPGGELVRGDVVLLAEGDRVPADLRLLSSSNVMVDESLLTGESSPVVKTASNGAADLPAQNDGSMVFAGTLVAQGAGIGEVVATGPRSAMGRIGSSLSTIGDDATPIQREARLIVRRVAIGGLAVAAAVAVGYGLTRDDWLRALLAGLTLAMAVIPEELPVVLTLFLGLGAWRLARENVLARNVPSVELLGATTVLCVDKTGTLTTNRMVVRSLWSRGAARLDVDRATAELPEALHPLLEHAVLASRRQAFDPMEQAIGELGHRLLAGTEHLHADWTLVEDYPLSAQLLAMSRVWRAPDSSAWLIAAKGAPEAIVDLCHLRPPDATAILSEVRALSSAGLRVLGVAQATQAGGVLPPRQHDFEFAFVGLLALEDPLRDDVPAAIAECRRAGVRVVMMTGDHPSTAVAIARQAGLSTEAGAVTGQELDATHAEDLDRLVRKIDLFCRVQPHHKLKLVQALRATGAVVAMTGDGVNDAPALKAAHIGVAMGARGTDVAREAADIVLLKDDFASLVTAVRYGRRIFANLRKAFTFVLAVHVPIVGLSVVPVLAGWPLLLLPAHILFLQLIIDPSCSLVFEAQELEPQAMDSGPRAATARLFDASALVLGLLQGAGLLALLLVVYRWVGSDGSEAVARTTMFIALTLSNIALIEANRSWGRATRRARAPVNKRFWAMAALTVLMLLVVVAVPSVSTLFAFALPDGHHVALAAAVALFAFGWFELSKRLVGAT